MGVKLFFAGMLLAVCTSEAYLYMPTTVQKIEITPSGHVYFQTDGFINTRWWLLNGTADGVKNSLTTLLIAKTLGISIRFEGGSYVSPTGPEGATEVYFCNDIQLQ